MMLRGKSAILRGMGVTALLLPTCTIAQEQGLDSPRLPAEMMSVFAPGQGENIETEDEAANLPPNFSSQRDMYRRLGVEFEDFSVTTAGEYYKPLDFAEVSSDEVASEVTPREGVRIVRDIRHNVPRVYGDTRSDAMFGAGYARAQDRLWQMDVNRHVWRSQSSALLGPGEDGENLDDDADTFRILDYSEAELHEMYRDLGQQYGEWGRIAQQDIRSYVDGVNAYIQEVRADESLLPLEYKRRGLEPADWSITDEMAGSAYWNVAWFAYGTREEGNSRLLLQLRERLGDEQAMVVYEDLRNDADPEATTNLDQTFDVGRTPVDERSVAHLDLGSFGYRSPRTGARFEPANASNGREGTSTPTKSNALLIGAAMSATGRPISVQGPQDGFETPHTYNLEMQIVAPDFMGRGIVEFLGPYPYNGGRGADFGVSATLQYSDAFDTFVLKLCGEEGGSATRYEYDGVCRPFETRVRRTDVAGSDEPLTLRSMRSVYGPVVGFAEVDGEPVALAQARTTFKNEEAVWPVFAELFTPSAVSGGEDFVRVVRESSATIGFYYVDDEDIAFVDPGIVPRRAQGTSGDFPIWGTGEWDWQGFDPASFSFDRVPSEEHPNAVNPDRGFIVGWNQQTAPGWSVADDQWNYGSVNRMTVLAEPLEERDGPLSVADAVRIHQIAGLTDLGAKYVYPLVKDVLASTPDADRPDDILAAMDRWQADGFLYAPNGSGQYQNGGAILAWRTWWPLLVRAVFEPTLGAEILDEASRGGNNLPWLSDGFTSYSGWIGNTSKDLRSALGRDVEGPYSRVYCGHGNLEACADRLTRSLIVANELARSEHGPNLAEWDCPTTSDPDICEDLDFPSTGAAEPVESIPFQNRPTFEIIVSYGDAVPLDE